MDGCLIRDRTVDAPVSDWKLDPAATEGRGDSRGSDRRGVDNPSSFLLLLSESESFLDFEVVEVLGGWSLPILKFCR